MVVDAVTSRARSAAWLRAGARRHWTFAAIMLAGVALRVAAQLTYQPAIVYYDSYGYRAHRPAAGRPRRRPAGRLGRPTCASSLAAKRPHPGAQLSLFETADGWRYSLWATNLPTTLSGWRANPTCYIDAAHRVHAQVEDRIRTGKNTGISHFPSTSFELNSVWLAASLIAATLLAWLRHLALDSDLARAEPKTLRYRVLHAAARLATSGRRRRLRIAQTWPWAQAIAAAWARVWRNWIRVHTHALSEIMQG